MPDPIILDGGLSNALEDLGHDLSDTLWSARLLRDDPQAIATVHRTYYQAGATVATTASYQASLPGFQAAGMTRKEAEHLITRSVQLAREVRDALTPPQPPEPHDARDPFEALERAAGGGRRRLLVAASVGSYGAFLADGSEYRGRYGVSKRALREFHLPRLELLIAAGPDLLAVETIPELDEAEVLVELLAELQFPAWFSYSIPGKEAFAILKDSPVIAVGINCVAPADVLPAVELAVAVTGKPAVAYPNGGNTWDAEKRSWTGEPVDLVPLAKSWRDAGAQYIGGCCQTGPDTIRRLAEAL